MRDSWVLEATPGFNDRGSDVSGPLEGQRNFLVTDPLSQGRNVTDIDRIEGRTLWEEKTAVNAKNRITGADETARWVRINVTEKFYRLLEARRYLPQYYECAEIGFHFRTPQAEPAFMAAVEAAIQLLRVAHPEVIIRVLWEE